MVEDEPEPEGAAKKEDKKPVTPGDPGGVGADGDKAAGGDAKDVNPSPLVLARTKNRKKVTLHGVPWVEADRTRSKPREFTTLQLYSMWMLFDTPQKLGVTVAVGVLSTVLLLRRLCSSKDEFDED